MCEQSGHPRDSARTRNLEQLAPTGGSPYVIICKPFRRPDCQVVLLKRTTVSLHLSKEGQALTGERSSFSAVSVGLSLVKAWVKVQQRTAQIFLVLTISQGRKVCFFGIIESYFWWPVYTLCPQKIGLNDTTPIVTTNNFSKMERLCSICPSYSSRLFKDLVALRSTCTQAGQWSSLCDITVGACGVLPSHKVFPRDPMILLSAEPSPSRGHIVAHHP